MLVFLHRLKAKNRTLLQAWQAIAGSNRSNELSRVTVDWPEKFLERFCSAFEIPFLLDGQSSASRPVRIDFPDLAELHIEYNIIKVTIYTLNGKKELEVITDKQPDDAQLLDLKLSHIFNGYFKINLTQKGSS